MDIKVISFNIRCANDIEGHSIAERAPRLKAILDECDADIIGFQECQLDWEKIIEKDYLNKYEMYLVQRKDPESCPILWKKERFDCIDKGVFWLSDTPDVMSGGYDDLYHCYRVCMWAILKDKTSGEQFLYMNTHFGFGDDAQTKSANLIAKRAKEIANLPTVLTGDFNLTPSYKTYPVLTSHFTDVNAVTTKDNRPTYHGYYFKEITEDYHIDFCFVNDKVTPVSQVILDQTFDGKFPSDHYGILSEIKI